jgi:prefoldin subunit 5
MFNNLTRLLVGVAIISLVVIGVVYALAVTFQSSIAAASPTLLLDIASGVICLGWLLLILRVPWDLYFETCNVLFEMRRSEERQLPVKPDRMRYVHRLRRVTGLLAVGAHLVSAAIIALLTYWGQGRVGYYFAVFYIVATLFRPASRAYQFLMKRLSEIRSEVKYPREDVVKLRHDVEQVAQQIRVLKETQVRSLEEGFRHVEKRLGGVEEAERKTDADVNDIRSMIKRIEQSFQERIHRLSEEMERSLMKAFDNQDIVNGLSAFAKLIKQA